MLRLTESLPSLSEEDAKQIEGVQQYFQKNNVHAILNQALAMLIQSRPRQARSGLVCILKKMKQRQRFFKKEDIQSIYECYNLYDGNNNNVTYHNLLQSLLNIGIKQNKQIFLSKHPQFKLQKYIKKFDFIKIYQEYYHQYLTPQQQWKPIPIKNKPRPPYQTVFKRIMYKDVGFDKFINPIKNYFQNKYNLLQNIKFLSKRGLGLVNDHKFIQLMASIKNDNFRLQNYEEIGVRIFEIFKQDHSAFHIMAHLFCQYFWVKKFKQNKKILQIQQQLSLIIKKLCKIFPPTVQGQLSVKEDIPFPTVPQRIVNLFGQNDGTYFASYQTLLFHMQRVNQKANQSYPYFKNLVQKIGSENNGFHYKTGLKLPKQVYDWFKVLIRIMEKMFPEIKDRKTQIILDAEKKLQLLGKANMQTVMSTILQTWIIQINDILTHRGGRAQYCITDLVRGKCMFKNVLGIKKAVNAVIRQCEQKQYEIIQLDNRLKKVTQDVVFKILIEQIVCQFQLALEFQSTKFQFGHCFYQIDRSPLGAIFGSYLFLGKDVDYPFLSRVRDTLAMYQQQPYCKWVDRDEKTIQIFNFIMQKFTQSNK